MKILLTNDDGISGEGLDVLKRVLEKKHEVRVIAPDKNRSGVSNGLVMFEPLKITKIDNTMYGYGGLPADCVCAGILGKSFFFDNFKPDVVVSGINRGANLGTDAVYSGTVGAARQAALLGVRGIAVSLAGDEFSVNSAVWNYEPLAQFVCDNLETLASYASGDIFVNINAAAVDSYTGACFTVLSRRDYHDYIEVKQDATDNEQYGIFQGGVVTSAVEPCRNMPAKGVLFDTAAVRAGKISVSCVYAHPSAVIPHGADQCVFTVDQAGAKHDK